ncbi:M23 family metallopeptidase [Enterococcus sp. LJL99]
MEGFSREQRAVILEFPLRGEWYAPTTPKKRIPSHGTNRFGLRYAFDFLQINWQDKKRPFYQVGFWQYLVFGVPLNKHYCWGQTIYAPCDGEIISIVDGIPERKVHWLRDLLIALRNSWFFDEKKEAYSKIAGNYLVLKFGDNNYCLFAHLKTNSINVSAHQKVKKGDRLGQVGHSGNSTSPHLHFQVMDSDDIAHSKGIPCLFEMYELYHEGKWRRVHHQMPSDKDRFRFDSKNM